MVSAGRLRGFTQQRVKSAVLAFYGYYAETTDVPINPLLRPSQYRINGELRQEPKEDALLSGLENSIQSLLEQRKRVFLVIDEPELPFLPRDCTKRPFFSRQTNCDVDRASVDQRQQGLRRIVQRLEGRFPALGVFDPLPMLCGELRCSPIREGFSYYRDNNHLSVIGSESIAGSLLAQINPEALMTAIRIRAAFHLGLIIIRPALVHRERAAPVARAVRQIRDRLRT